MITGIYLTLLFTLAVLGFNVWAWLQLGNTVSAACIPVNIGVALWLLILAAGER